MMDEKTEENQNECSEDQTLERPKRSRLRRYGSFCWSTFTLAAFVIIGLLLGGLVHYMYIVTTPPTTIAGKADGIVVLTGGENRLDKAIALLQDGRAKRLLITGVNPTITQKMLRETLKGDKNLFACCVDIDHSAKDTIGNAFAAKSWATDLNASSLFVVTGAFHMPRALKELSHALGDMELKAVPVNTPQNKNWWRDHSRLRDMLREYAKLIFVTGRDQFNQWTGQPWPNNMLRRNIASNKNDGKTTQ